MDDAPLSALSSIGFYYIAQHFTCLILLVVVNQRNHLKLHRSKKKEGGGVKIVRIWAWLYWDIKKINPVEIKSIYMSMVQGRATWRRDVAGDQKVGISSPTPPPLHVCSGPLLPTMKSICSHTFYPFTSDLSAKNGLTVWFLSSQEVCIYCGHGQGQGAPPPPLPADLCWIGSHSAQHCPLWKGNRFNLVGGSNL
jgi:hypothetical protein